MCQRLWISANAARNSAFDPDEIVVSFARKLTTTRSIAIEAPPGSGQPRAGGEVVEAAGAAAANSDVALSIAEREER
jgi:hypothetical protein